MQVEEEDTPAVEEYIPAAHSEHSTTAAAPDPVPKVPAAQASHADMLEIDWYEPATHRGHVVRPDALAKVPAMQDAQVPLDEAARAVE